MSEPGRQAALAARKSIEEALFGLQDIPLAFDRDDLRDRLLHAMACAYAVLDTPVLASAHLDGLGEGAAIVVETHALLARAGNPDEVAPLRVALTHLSTAVAALHRGAESVAQIQLDHRIEIVGGARDDALKPVVPFRASVDLPELHTLQRRPLLPHITVEAAVPPAVPVAPAATPPRPTTFEALDRLVADTAAGELVKQLAGPPEGEQVEAPRTDISFPYEPAVEEVEVLRSLARDCLDDIASFRALRTPNAIETWLDQAPFEQRLLDNIDAFAALGGSALPLVSLFHAEAKNPDRARAFAVALTLGCIDGSDTVGAAVMTLKQSDPEEHPGWMEGFWLAPNPAIDEAMADLCTSARPELVALALDVLHARGRTPDATIIALLDRPESAIAARVARALATALPRHDAIDWLERICATTKDDDLFLAAIESLLRRGHGPALDLLRHVIDAPISGARGRRALPLFCLVGRASDLDRLLAAANETPTVRLLRALGRFGHVESLGTLINFLEHEDTEVVAAAAEALDRITGAGLRETVEEPWEIELPPEAADVGGIPVPTRKVERVVTDSARWSAWVQDNARRFDAKTKMRGGVPFTPMQIVVEMEAKSTPPDRREDASLELALVTGIVSPFSPHDWVARQKKHLAELRAQVSAVAASPGAWLIAVRRHAGEEASPVEQRPFIRVPGPVQIDETEPGVLPPLADQPEMRWARWAGSQEVNVAAAIQEPPSPSKSQLSMTTDVQISPFHRPVLPFAVPASSGPPPPAPTTRMLETMGSPLITIEQYAWLCVELRAAPANVNEIMRRYGLAPEQAAAVDAYWKSRVGAEPAMRAAFDRAYAAHKARFTAPR